VGAETKIQWCHHTFNPWRGCTKIAPGCENCYAARDAKRFPKIRGTWGPNGTRVRAADWNEPMRWNMAASIRGERRRVFCASLADVFEDWPGSIVDHEGAVLWIAGVGTAYIPQRRHGSSRGVRPATMDDLRRDLFELIDRTPWLDWLLVTKRPENIRHFFWGGFRENVWLLTSVSDQATADAMIPRILECNDLAPVLGVSAEPLLAPIDFRGRPSNDMCIICGCRPEQHGFFDNLPGSHQYRSHGLDWIIFGGESGPKARPCNLAWIADGLEQCQAAGVAAFMKQAGAFPVVNVADDRFWQWARGTKHIVHQHAKASHRLIEVRLKDDKGGDLAELPEVLRVREFPTPARKAVLA
jgi:protein gp37